ncbi:dehydrogenase/reductase SDR family member 4-like isoform X2 [Pleurodeles waltl]|uniref:dehydrogenase/reductase SDR family member 4-like isoform X2 n=1 Tax=Pleurodeles waltl TaxID=8319 RepID=UPI003709ADF9
MWKLGSRRSAYVSQLCQAETILAKGPTNAEKRTLKIMNTQSQNPQSREKESPRSSKERTGIHSQKVAIITASTTGIGLAIARRLAEDGAHVVISSRKQDNVEKAVKQLQSENLSVTGITCHAAKEEDRERLVNTALQKYGRIDFLICNAAVNPHVGQILDSTEDQWKKIFDVNVISTFLMAKLVVPHLKKHGSGSIVLISSVGAYIPYEMFGPYCVSKTALLALTKALTPELLAMNIRVNCVVPGFFKTAFSRVLWEEETMKSQVMTHFKFSRWTCTLHRRRGCAI